ncbi:MAG: hypothetical protein H0U55_08925, partial [Rubrobacteraceae bacterium]|nr:hypothetical protein [Rubrobacteraceae bacterium]
MAGANGSRGRSGRVKNAVHADTREAAREIPLLQRQNLEVFSMIEVGRQWILPGEIESPPLKGPGVGMHLSAPRRLLQQRNERTREELEVPSAVD